LPPLIQEDPHDMGADKRRSLGIVELPTTLDQAWPAWRATRS